MQKKKSGIYFIFLIAGFLLIALSFLCVDAKVEEISGWHGQEELKPTEVVQLDDNTREFYFNMLENEIKGESLAFFSTHMCAEVYEDGEKIYALTGDDSFVGKTPGARWNFVEIEPGAKEIMVRLQAVYPQV